MTNTTPQTDTLITLADRLAAEHRTLRGNAKWRGYATAKAALWAAALHAPGDFTENYDRAVAHYTEGVGL